MRGFFKCPKICNLSANYSRPTVSNQKPLIEKVLPHFESFRRIGGKNENLLIFKEWLGLLARKEDRQGNVQKIVELCYDYNMGGKRRRLSKEEYLRTIAS